MNNTSDIANNLMSGKDDNFEIVAYVFFSVITTAITVIEMTLLKLLKNQSVKHDEEKGDVDSDEGVMNVVDPKLKRTKSAPKIDVKGSEGDYDDNDNDTDVGGTTIGGETTLDEDEDENEEKKTTT
jgi:hypothetical protein